VLVNAGNAALGAVPGQFTWSLLAGSHTNKLDLLMARWTSSQLGTITTFIEVVGGFLCPLGDLKALYPTAADAVLAQRRTQLEVRLEGALGYAAVPRYSREVHVPQRNRLDLWWSHVRQLREIIVENTAYDAATIATTQFNPSTGRLYYVPSTIARGGVATVGYEHGDDFTSPDIRRAMELLGTEMWGNTLGPYDTRVVRREADGQAITYASPSLSGGTFLTPELNSIVKSERKVLVR
jgi:hypothetical protein